MTKGCAGLLPAALLLALAQEARAGETISYSYDSLGRLVRVERSGTVNQGVNAAYCYDPADNRTLVTVNPASAQCPAASPPPPPGNQAPVAVADSARVARCISTGVAVYVVTNDYDPDGSMPLELLSASYGGGLGTATLASDSRISFQPNGSSTGSAAVTYTIRDSAGATATGTLSVEVVQGRCP